ncbi:hypothetical protein SmJEL517_g01702 [Synchytrium microbalum]|uniref:CRAL-TRIO domain-containing protein n=1 Tax=Synchytrium microbalum TaxID=1806994 RepID=A0A507CEJ9_9FUNG|nr:uncharacterized protein SmJEL517_g01702 [Synchytrium microbalum]TPX35943.1 hypothetical protein SmJEL517_g01702 [Synchytrium microbalum]
MPPASPIPRPNDDTKPLSDEERKNVIWDMRTELGGLADGVDDYELLRFAVARQNNIKQASKMFTEYLEWRKRDRVDELPVPSVNGAPLLQHVRGYKTIPDGNINPHLDGVPEKFKSWYGYSGGGGFHKLDKDGQPVFIERMGLYDVQGMIKYCTAESIVDIHIRNAEFLTRVLMKECSDRAGRNIEKHTVIFDFEGTGFHQFDMRGLALLKSITEVEQAYYPERLDRLFIINAPFLFTKVWAIVKPWLAPAVLDKIHIFGSNYQDTLLKHIDADSLPKYLGGTCECAHMQGGCVPSPQLDHKHQNYGFQATIDGKDEHTFEVECPQTATNGAMLVYGFKSSGQGCRFEIRHRQQGGVAETSILPSTLHDSDKKIVTGQFPAIPGIYIFGWRKPPAGWVLSGPAVKLEYNIEVLDPTEALGLANPTDAPEEPVNMESDAPVASGAPAESV